MEKYLLGIDIGTTDIKAVIFSISGHEIASFRKANHIISEREGYFEQDMNELWGNLLDIIKNLKDISPINFSDIVSIGLSGQGEGCWLIDENGLPIRNAILWNDTRSMPMIDALDSDFLKRYKEITGSIQPTPGGMNFILKWMDKYEHSVLEKATCCFFCKDWVGYKLTGVKATDYTDMSTSLLDLSSNKLSQKMFQMLGIETHKHLIPQILDSNTVRGYITKEIADITGLQESTVVSVGYIDVVATGVGIGAIDNNEVCSILGTSCVSEYVSKTFNTFDGNASYLRHGDKSKYYCLIGTMSGMPNMDWILENIFSDLFLEHGKTRKFYNLIEEGLKDTEVGSQGLIYHPYIRGERSPFLNINAKSSFFGITENTNRWNMLRAVYEGLAYSIKDCFQSYKPSHVFLTGGGTNSPILVQVMADCLGVDVTIEKCKELGAKGAAISAGVAVGLFDNIYEAVQKFKGEYCTISPISENTLIYKEYFNLYKMLQKDYFEAWDYRTSIIKNIKNKGCENVI